MARDLQLVFHKEVNEELLTYFPDEDISSWNAFRLDLNGIYQLLKENPLIASSWSSMEDKYEMDVKEVFNIFSGDAVIASYATDSLLAPLMLNGFGINDKDAFIALLSKVTADSDLVVIDENNYEISEGKKRLRIQIKDDYVFVSNSRDLVNLVQPNYRSKNTAPNSIVTGEFILSKWIEMIDSEIDLGAEICKYNSSLTEGEMKIEMNDKERNSLRVLYETIANMTSEWQNKRQHFDKKEDEENTKAI